MPSSEAFTIHEVAAGVWAAVAPGTFGTVVSNAAIVDLGHATLVVDTFMTLMAAAELATASRELTGRTPSLVVNTHFHADHVGGNAAFGGAHIVATPRTRELIAADGHPGGRLPDLLTGERLTVVGERRAEILGYGPAHTESDLFVHLPDDGVLVAGDLVWTGIHPKTSDGFPAEWAVVADRLADLGPARVVPGHGAPGTAADVCAMAGYLRELESLVAAVRAGDLEAAGADPPPGFEDWADPDRFRRGLAALAAVG